MGVSSGGGQFRPHKLQAWRQKLSRERRARITKFTELIAEGYTMSAAARAMGLSQQAGSSMFKQICEELGVNPKGD